VVGTVQDITWRKQAELQLEESFRSLQIAQDELVRRERLATLGQLAGGVAHELRTPLGILRNSVYYLEHVLSMEDQTMREVLGEMQRAIGSSDHIIGEMLDYVREPSRERTSFAVGDAIKRALHAVPFPAGVNLQGPSGERSARVLASQDQVTRILVNLLQNSIQALSHSGSIEIIVCRADNEVWIDVGDTGCGIPPENLERIFDPLFTTKTRGIGLGLAISRRYARLQGGALTVKSTPGEGTIFRLALPGAPD
jgi:signal transduction histidine kinase